VLSSNADLPRGSLNISLDQPPIILIIDDAPDGRETLKTLLTGHGYTLAFAKNGIDGLAAASALIPDLILLDVMMPGMDGFEVCRQVRANKLLAEVPIILITALEDRQSRIKGIEAGADDFISKYFDATELRARVRTITRLNRHRRLLMERMKFEQVIELSPNGLLLANADGTILLSNSALVHLLGARQAEELLGESLLRFITPDSYDACLMCLRQAVAAPVNTQRLEITMMRLDGTLFAAEIDAGHLVWDEGKLAQIVVRDITQRKQLEARLFQAQKMESIGRLAGGVAHDFNNLLTVISGYAGLALDTLPANMAERDDLLAIQRASQSAANLTRQLLAFARKQMIAPRILDLNELILDMDQLLQRLIGENIQLTTLPGSDLGMVKADPGQIEQVVINLVLNARDAMPNGGKLTIKTVNSTVDAVSARQRPGMTAGAYVLLMISDTGVGMDAATHAHIFEPFFTTKAVGLGTGLGLATCYGIVKQHGGSIWASSRLGHGTRFSIYLPQVMGTAQALPERVVEAVLPQGNEMILLVEDESAVRQFVARILRSLGYTVLEAAHGEQAITMAQQGMPAIDLLLTDLVMPKLGGLALAEQLVVFYPAIALLFISGYTEHDIANSSQLPQAAMLQKPFSALMLARCVRDALDARPH